MKTVAVSDFKARCLALLEDVARTGEPLLVVKRGKPLARVLPSGGVAAAHPQDTLRGTLTILGDIVGPTSRASDWSGELPAPRRSVRRAKRT